MDLVVILLSIYSGLREDLYQHSNTSCTPSHKWFDLSGSRISSSARWGPRKHLRALWRLGARSWMTTWPLQSPDLNSAEMVWGCLTEWMKVSQRVHSICRNSFKTIGKDPGGGFMKVVEGTFSFICIIFTTSVDMRYDFLLCFFYGYYYNTLFAGQECRRPKIIIQLSWGNKNNSTCGLFDLVWKNKIKK